MLRYAISIPKRFAKTRKRDKEILASRNTTRCPALLRSFGKEKGWYEDCSKHKTEAHHMASRSIRKGTRQQCLSWGVLLFLASYSLSLCTLNPLVHADTLRRAAQTQHPSAGHCSQPATIPQATVPRAADHERPTAPLCCDLRGRHNKVLRTSSRQADTTPLLLLTRLPRDICLLTGEVQSLHLIQSLPSSRPPPLYLFHSVLLI